MPINKASAKNAPSNTQLAVYVSNDKKNHDINLIGTAIAEIEVTPYESSTMSLGIFNEPVQPKGFSIEYHYKGDRPQDITSSITAKPVNDGLLYVLRVANNTNYAVCAEIRVL